MSEEASILRVGCVDTALLSVGAKEASGSILSVGAKEAADIDAEWLQASVLDPILTEDGFPILTEDGQFLYPE